MTVPVSNPVELAIGLLGSEAKLALAAGVSQVAINKAKRRVSGGGKVSAELAVKIESATKGAVSRSRLRADLWPQTTERADS